MPLTPGSRIGVFQLVDLIGRGGMGEVYRATDTKLKRQVAIKILPPSFAADHDRLARFQREAEVLASLNHPNIAAIYGLEEGAGITALVMELVEGDDLSQRIARGAIPVDEALPIAKQIAEALEAAHEQGIIHRDLKPANIKVRSDGTVKVLDFGLAKAMEPAGAMSPGLSQAPTITTPAMTQAGMILGTAAYMSPEQAKGRTVDKRSDVWAFGAVLFEMLTGRRAFEGEDVSDTLARILMKEPDWTALPATVPPAVATVMRRCLQKDRKQRVRDIGDVFLALEGAFETVVPSSTTTTTSAASSRRPWIALAAVALIAAAALAVPTVRHLREAPPPETRLASEMRLEVVTPTGADTDLTSFAISPDGGSLVFRATVNGRTQFWLRSFESETAQPLVGTDGGQYPFWSPDNRSVGFFANGQLKRIDVLGGAVQTVADAPLGIGGTWSPDGVILFNQAVTGPLYRVPAGGGEAVAVTRVDPPRQIGHRFPQFLPDGRRFLFFARGTPETQGVYLGSLGSTDTRRLFSADVPAVFAPPAHVLFARQGVLLAQRLDPDTLAPAGDSVPVARQVLVDPSTPMAALSASAVGSVTYRAGAGERQLIWLDRRGQQNGALGGPDTSQPGGPRLSSDGRTVALTRTIGGNMDV